VELSKDIIKDKKKDNLKSYDVRERSVTDLIVSFRSRKNIMSSWMYIIAAFGNANLRHRSTLIL